MEERVFICMKCRAQTTDRYDLTWTHDRYGIPYQLVCNKCYDKAQSEIQANSYGNLLTDDEIYGEDE